MWATFVGVYLTSGIAIVLLQRNFVAVGCTRVHLYSFLKFKAWLPLFNLLEAVVLISLVLAGLDRWMGVGGGRIYKLPYDL